MNGPLALLLILTLIGVWYWYEGRWDRELFKAPPDCTCANLSPKQANQWLRAHPDTQVLDVRSANEFASGALPNALNISLGDDHFTTKVARLDRHKPVLVYCAGGFRSRKAVAVLKQLGFENIQHIHRGYMSWSPSA